MNGTINTGLFSTQHALFSVRDEENIYIRKKGKVKCTLVQALRLCTSHKANRGSRG
jgi:hypothetical protein